MFNSEAVFRGLERNNISKSAALVSIYPCRFCIPLMRIFLLYSFLLLRNLSVNKSIRTPLAVVVTMYVCLYCKGT